MIPFTLFAKNCKMTNTTTAVGVGYTNLYLVYIRQMKVLQAHFIVSFPV